MKRFLLAACLIGTAWCTEAAGLRLVLRSGWVVPLSADSTQLAGDAQLLDLPQAARGEHLGIYSAKPDYATGRLYVVPQTPPASRVTVVYDLANYRRIGVMPGVSDVTIPADPKTPTLYTRTWTLDDPARTDTSLEYLMFENAKKTTGELRDRADYAKVLARSETSGATVLAQCFSERQQAYATSVPYAVVDTRLVKRDLPGADAIDTRAALLQQGSPQDCWENGDQLLALASRSTLRHEGLDFSKPIVARRSAGGEYRRFVGDDHAWAIDRRYALRALGTDGRWAALLTDGFGRLFDFATQTEHPSQALGNPYWAQLSADRQTLYLFSLTYESRGGGHDSLYIDGGASRNLDDYLSRITVAGGEPRSGRIVLPKALTEIKDYYRRVDFINAGEASAEEKRQQIDALAPLGPLGQKIGRVEIVGVIAD